MAQFWGSLQGNVLVIDPTPCDSPPTVAAAYELPRKPSPEASKPSDWWRETSALVGVLAFGIG